MTSPPAVTHFPASRVTASGGSHMWRHPPASSSRFSFFHNTAGPFPQQPLVESGGEAARPTNRRCGRQWNPAPTVVRSGTSRHQCPKTKFEKGFTSFLTGKNYLEQLH